MANLRANKIYGTSGPDANGSALFNGTDYLTASNAAAFRLNQGSGADLTIEAWIYAKSYDTQFVIAGLYHTSGNKRSYQLYVNTDGELKFNYSSSGTAGTTSVLNAGVIPTNQWIHVAVTHDTSATTLRLFKNGLLRDDDTSAMATWYANTDGDFVVGSSLDGFISNLHINKGTCKYTASFDPYKQPIEVETNTSVLCCNSSTDALNDDKSNTFVQTASDGVKPTSDMPFSRSDGGVVFDGDIKMNSQGVMYFPTGDTSQRGRGRGVIVAGENPAKNKSISYVEMQSGGIAVDFGNLTKNCGENKAVGSSTRGVIQLSGDDPATINTLEYITFATTSNSTDFGDLFAAWWMRATGGNNTRGLFAGGLYPGSTFKLDVEYITIATTGNGIDFGDLGTARNAPTGCASPTRMLVAGGQSGPATSDRQNIIEYLTIATIGNATDFGDLTAGGKEGCSAASSTRGVFGPRLADPAIVNTIDYVTIATLGDAVEFGDGLTARGGSGSLSNSIRGAWAGGYTPSLTNSMEYVDIATTGNAKAFCDLTYTNQYGGGCSDSHGGLS